MQMRVALVKPAYLRREPTPKKWCSEVCHLYKKSDAVSRLNHVFLSHSKPFLYLFRSEFLGQETIPFGLQIKCLITFLSFQ